MRRDLIRIQNGSGRHKKVMVLEDIQMELQCGEVQGVFFENREEEESLMRVLCGEAKLAGGMVYYQDVRYEPQEAAGLFKEKIFLPVFQSEWAEELTVTDFFCLYEQCFGKQRKLIERKIHTLSEVFGLEYQPDQRIQQLSNIQKVRLELIRAYDRAYEVVILRGLTTVLGEEAFCRIMKLVDELRQRNMTFLILDHAEVLARFCTTQIYAVSRGRTVYVYKKAELRAYLQGKSWEKDRREQDTGWNGEVLQIRGVALDEKVRVDLSVYAGEIVTVLDTKGSYINSLAAILRGDLAYEQGNIWYRGIPFAPAGIREVIHKGIGIIEEHEGGHRQELFYNLSALENLELLLAEKEPVRLIKKNRHQSIIKESAQFFSEQELNTMVAELSSRQRQRLVYYRWYLCFPQLIICVRPLTSLDRQMREEAEQMIRRFQERGIAVLVLTANAMAAEVFGGRCIIL